MVESHHVREAHRKAASSWRRYRLAVGLIQLISLASLPVGAQEGGGADSPDPDSRALDPDVEEILVRGQMAQGIDTDSAVSVTAFDASDLQAMGVESVQDIARFTPGLEIRSASSTTPIFFIRGVGLNDFTANAAGAVAIYVDNVALDLPAVQNTPVFDVETIEVLRGPQGYGPGRNASAGAIKLYTRKPSGTQEGYIRFDYGNFNYIDTEGAIETPILGDFLSTRVSFRLTQRDGIVTNRCAGAPPLAERDGQYCLEEPNANGYPVDVPARLNNQDRWAARGLLRFMPPKSNSEWLLGVHGSRVDQLGTVGQSIGTRTFFGGSSFNPDYRQPEIAAELESISNSRCGGNFPGADGVDFGCGVVGNLDQAPRRIDFPRGGPGATEYRAARDEYNAKKEVFLDVSRATLGENLSERPLDTKPFEGDYNIAGYERLEAYGAFLRGDWELGNTSLRSISGYESYDRELQADYDYSPKVILEFESEDTAWQFTQDIEWSGEVEDAPLGWSTGGYFLAGNLDWLGRTLPGGDRPRVIQEYVQKTWSFGVYGAFDWQFLDDFTLSGGVRYNWERKEFDAKQITRFFTDRCVEHPIQNPNVLECEDQATYSSPTGSINVDYMFSDDVSMYWRYTHGWKGPQYTIGSGQTAESNTLAKPEEIDALEWGIKANWLDDRLQVNGSLFWYDYANYQVFLFENNYGSPPVRKVINASAARLYGGELDVTIEPIDRLIAVLRFGWLESRFLDFTDTGAVLKPFSLIPPLAEVYTRTFDYTGNRLPNTPRFKLSGSLEYTVELGRFGSIRPRYDFSWTDDIFFDPSQGRGAPNEQDFIFMPQYAVGQKAYWLHDIVITYATPDGRIEVAGWVRNIADEVYRVGAFDVSVAAGMVNSLIGDPRTYGMSLRVDF